MVKRSAGFIRQQRSSSTSRVVLGQTAASKGQLLSAAFIVLSPIIGFCLSVLFSFLTAWIFRRWSPWQVDRFFRFGQLFSSALFSLGHGANDAQKTMGIIVMVLVATGYEKDFGTVLVVRRRVVALIGPSPEFRRVLVAVDMSDSTLLFFID